ncbi:MAG TPA: sugar ABC transporter substrate-binding protein [Thermoanaerobaculia bacterium]|nr:sugar ABC transporter substrate-binding protein [Thermoanaerobaculia bacterium]
MRRAWLVPRNLTLALALLLLTTCSSQTSDHRERLEFWALGSEGEAVASFIPEFERRNPDIHVVVQQIPWSAAHEKLVTAFVGDAMPDISHMGNTWMPEFVALNALDDLGPYVASSAVVKQSDYFPGIWATNVVGATLYGIPWYVDTRVLFYRSDVLAEVGFPHGPRTWAEWRDAMQRIHDQKKCRWAILLPTNEYEPITMLALSNHATLLTPDGTRGAFSEPGFAGAFAFYVDTFRRGWAPAVSNSEIANLYQQFAEGDFAMYITGPWNVGEFRKRLPPEMQDKWATAPLPAVNASEPMGISMAGGGSLVVFRASRHKAAARKLIDFLSEPAQQVRFYELVGDLPARRAAWQSPLLANDKHFPAFRAQLERVTPIPKVPEWEQIATAIYDRGEAAARGAVPPAVALRQLDARADELLEKRRWMLAQSRSRGAAATQSRVGESP